MYKIDELSLITGMDIFIPEYEVKIHQPTINEIALIGEEMFFSSLNIFMIENEKFKINLINCLSESNEEDIKTINDFTEFDIILFLLKSDQDFIKTFRMIIDLVIKEYNFEFIDEESRIFLRNEDRVLEIDEQFFTILKDIIYKIFIFDKLFDKARYKPVNEAAARIAKKLELAKAKTKVKDSNNNENSFIANIISILGVNHQNINDLTNFTLYQLYNQFERYSLYLQYDQGMKAALAGAKVDIVDWFKQL